MSDSHERLRRVALPAATGAFGCYSPAVTHGGFVFLSGQGPIRDGQVLHPGRLGADVTIEQGRAAARLAMLNLLAQLQHAAGGLEHVERCLRTTVYVSSAEGFFEQPRVADGATEVLEELFGRDALPARSAVGVYLLPMNICVEVDAVFALRRG